MPIEKITSSDRMTAGLMMGTQSTEKAVATGVYAIQCFDTQGSLKWEAESKNLVVNVGLQDMNTKYFTGSAYTAAWYIGIYGAGASSTPAATDTMTSHAGWTEVVSYSDATRPVCIFGAPTNANPSVATNTASPATYNINATATIGGAFLVSDSTKGGATGTLYSAADFGAPGDRSVVSGDILIVRYTLSLAG